MFLSFPVLEKQTSVCYSSDVQGHADFTMFDDIPGSDVCGDDNGLKAAVVVIEHHQNLEWGGGEKQMEGEEKREERSKWRAEGGMV